MKRILLTNEELYSPKNKTKGGFLNLEKVREAQNEKTLKTVGRWLKRISYLDNGGGRYILREISNEINKLEKGIMPRK